MIYGAISTDIKKSSANWNLDSEWMQKAVQYINTISELVFEKAFDKNINQIQLPNSPEGDAYTFYFWTDQKKEYLQKHLAKIASAIQFNLQKARESIKTDENKEGVFLCGYSTEQIKEKLKRMITDEKEKDKEKLLSLIDIYEHYDEKYSYIGNIFLRVGIAISEYPAIPYRFNAKKSYRGSVISMSEKAEEKAPYVSGFGEYENGKSVEKKNIYNDLMRLSLDKKDIVSRGVDYTYTPVAGFIIFVHYKMALSEELMRKNNHIEENVKDEFRTLHAMTVESMWSIGATLVKIKRDSSSMYFIPKDSGTFKSQRVYVWDECSKLLSLLPKDSSIGISFGEKEFLTEVSKKKNDTINKDYFGPTVNIAARMAAINWQYSTTVGDTVPSSHLNRVAYADTNRKNIVDILEPNGRRSMTRNTAAFIPYPYSVDKIPIVQINVGYSGYVYVLSKYIHGKSDFKLGTHVKWSHNKIYKHGIIEEIDISRALVKTLENQVEWVPLRLLEKDTDESIVRDKIKKMFKYKFKF